MTRFLKLWTNELTHILVSWSMQAHFMTQLYSSYRHTDCNTKESNTKNPTV